MRAVDRLRTCLLAVVTAGGVAVPAVAQKAVPSFLYADQALFTSGSSLTNAAADFDNDGDLDLFVGFNGAPNRLYRNESGRFTDVAAMMGLADSNATRTAAWGDFDGDGRLDLFVGFAPREQPFSRLYRSEGPGEPFRDVTTNVGASLAGSFRQASWVDYDGDGDANGLFRNDGDLFVDVAAQAGLADGGRGLGDPGTGTVRPTLVDFDNDGDLDVFMANYGPNGLFRNRGDGAFENVAVDMGLANDGRYDASVWGDVDLDGRIDLFVNGTITGGVSYPDFLYLNAGDRFVESTPELLKSLEADHGALWFDFDGDGDLDLALTGAAVTGMHQILRNETPRADGHTSLQVLVEGADGRPVHPGAEVRLYDSGSGALLGTRIVDTGSGYNSQSAMPVHFGIAREAHVDVEVTIPDGKVRRTFRVDRVDPAAHAGEWLSVSGDR